MCQRLGLIVHVKTHHDRNLCTMRPSARCGQVFPRSEGLARALATPQDFRAGK